MCLIPRVPSLAPVLRVSIPCARGRCMSDILSNPCTPNLNNISQMRLLHCQADSGSFPNTVSSCITASRRFIASSSPPRPAASSRSFNRATQFRIIINVSRAFCSANETNDFLMTSSGSWDDIWCSPRVMRRESESSRCRSENRSSQRNTRLNDMVIRKSVW